MYLPSIYVKLHLNDIVAFLFLVVGCLIETYVKSMKLQGNFTHFFSCFLFANVEEVPHPSPSKH